MKSIDIKKLSSIINKCKDLAFELNFTKAEEWKGEDDKRVIVGYMPIYVPNYQ